MYKIPEDEVFKIQPNHNPTDLYTLESKLYEIGDLSVHNAKDNTHGSMRLIKYSSRLNDNEIKALRELREQDRLIQLIEGFQFTSSSNGNKTQYALVYSHAVPICDFISFKHKYSEELVVKVLRQLLDALQWIHLHGFVHLNIHPLTILNANLTQVNVKLAGFDHAAQIGDVVRETTTGEGASSRSIFSDLLESSPVEFTCKLSFFHYYSLSN